MKDRLEKLKKKGKVVEYIQKVRIFCLGLLCAANNAFVAPPFAGYFRRCRCIRMLCPLMKISWPRSNQIPRIQSAFADNQYLAFTELTRLIHTHSISKLVVVGLATDYCVRWTAIDSRKFGITTEVVKAGIRAVYPENADAVLQELESWGCSIV